MLDTPPKVSDDQDPATVLMRELQGKEFSVRGDNNGPSQGELQVRAGLILQLTKAFADRGTPLSPEDTQTLQNMALTYFPFTTLPTDPQAKADALQMVRAEIATHANARRVYAQLPQGVTVIPARDMYEILKQQQSQ